MSVTRAPYYSHADAYAQGYDDGLRAARRPAVFPEFDPARHIDHSEAVSFPASAHPGEPCPDAGGEHPHHHDITLTFTQRTVLRRLLDRRPLAELDLDVVVGPLVGAGLVGHDGAYWCLTAEGRAYLAAHDEAKTRRTERPGPPKLPQGWTVGGGDERLGYYNFEGTLVSGMGSSLGGGSFTPRRECNDFLSAYEEAARAKLALIAYLRARLAYQSREARDGAAPPQGTAVSDGIPAGAGEPSPSEVAP